MATYFHFYRIPMLIQNDNKKYEHLKNATVCQKIYYITKTVCKNTYT